MRLNPHLHAVVLDGAWYVQGGELCWEGLGHLKTSEVGAVLKSTVKRIERHLRCRGLLQSDEDEVDPDVPDDPESNLAASAVSGRTPPAGPQWMSGLAPLQSHALGYDKPLCTSLAVWALLEALLRESPKGRLRAGGAATRQRTHVAFRILVAVLHAPQDPRGPARFMVKWRATTEFGTLNPSCAATPGPRSAGVPRERESLSGAARPAIWRATCLK